MAKEKENAAPAEDKPQLEVLKFYAAVLSSDGSYATEEFDTLDELQARLTELVDRDVSVFSFAGVQLKVSKPPFRHLLTPWGNKPLFAVPTDNLEPDDTGYLGLDPAHLEQPPQVKLPSAQKNSAASDEFFSDETDTVTNIFDTILPDPDN
jgi:hypothetical protein